MMLTVSNHLNDSLVLTDRAGPMLELFGIECLPCVTLLIKLSSISASFTAVSCLN